MTGVSRARRLSLRTRLALLGLAPVLLPLAALLGVAGATENEVVDVGADGRVTAASDAGLSPWVPAAAAVLAVAAGASAWWWAGRAVRPLRRMAELADATGSGTMDRRLGLRGAPPEVQVLADGFDGMLDRLAAAAAVQRQVVEDTSHELRTPLAVLRTTADVVLARPDADAGDLREAVERMRGTAERLADTVDAGLERARAGHALLEPAAADLAALARRVVEDRGPLAAAGGQRLTAAGPATPAAMDVASAERAVAELVDNALRYGGAGAGVLVEAGTAGGRAFVAVTDDGPGVGAGDRERMFERYWRGPAGGRGIGLAVVAVVARAHDGVDVESPVAGTGRGTRVTLWFRTAPPADGGPARHVP